LIYIEKSCFFGSVFLQENLRIEF